MVGCGCKCGYYNTLLGWPSGLWYCQRCGKLLDALPNQRILAAVHDEKSAVLPPDAIPVALSRLSMCRSCLGHMHDLAGNSAKITAKWTCPQCGPQEFAKEPDPPEVRTVSIWPDVDSEAVIIVAIAVCLTAVVIAAMALHH